MKRDEFFMGMAKEAATQSKDRSTKVGCVIVLPDGGAQVLGWNGFVRGAKDDIEERHQRPAKYLWTEHAERNAIFNAARKGIRTEGATMYLPWFPCADCARAIAQAGIERLVCHKPDMDDERWGAQFRVSLTILVEGKVELAFLEP